MPNREGETLSKLIVRPLTAGDRPRVMEISSEIWDGEDYVPGVFDHWLAESGGEAAGVSLNGHLIAFAHRTWLHPGVAWFEGIRADASFRGHGAGRALTEHLIEGARKDGAKRICLSTYIDNEASIHIIEAYGFSRVASFALLEKEIPSTLAGQPQDGRIEEVGEGEAIPFIAGSPFLRLARGRFPRGWRFFPFHVDPNAAIARMQIRWGIRENGTLRALACIRQGEAETGPFTLNFLDGDREAARSLLQEIHRRYAGRRVEVMVPRDKGSDCVLLELLQESGYTSCEDDAAAVFVYERIL